MFLRTSFCAVFCALFSLSSAVFAQGVDEMNYNHLNPEASIPVPKVILSPTSRPAHQRFARGMLGPSIGNGSKTADAKQVWAFAVLFDEDSCAFGAKIGIDSRGVRHSVEVTFSFIDRAGVTIDKEIRYPAGGTTRQAFRIQGTDQGFAVVHIRSENSPHLQVSDMRAQPCATPTS